MEATRQLVTPNLFPSANVVYVDNDYAKLRSKNLLAYGTLEEAVASWRNGPASGKYGATHSGNPGTILLGAGFIRSHTGNVSYQVDIDYLNIIGVGKDSTILSTNVSINNGVILGLQAEHINLSNFTITNTIDCPYAFSQSASGMEGKFFNLKFNGPSNSSSRFLQFDNSLNGVIENCEFDFSKRTTNSVTSDILINGNFGGRLDNCIFKFNSFSSTIINTSAGSSGVLSDCWFRGNVNGYVLNFGGASTQLLEINDCRFETEYGKGIYSSTVPFSVLITDSSFVTSGTCLEFLGTTSTKIANCHFNCYRGDGSAIICSGGTNNNGMTMFSSRVLGNGTGLGILAVPSTIITTGAISHNILRMPNGDINGSSISSNFVNTIATPFNSELTSSTNN